MPKDPFLPPMRALPKRETRDPFLPVVREEVVIPEVMEVIGSKDLDLDKVVRDLLDVPYNIPRHESAVRTYLASLIERLRLHSYNKMAEKWDKQISTISTIVASARSTQQARVELLGLLIDEEMTPRARKRQWEIQLKELEAQEEEIEARKAEARKRKRLADED